MTAVWLGAAGAALADLAWQGVLAAAIVAGALHGAGAALPRFRHAVASAGVVALALGFLTTMLVVVRVATTTTVTWGTGSGAMSDAGLVDPAWLPRLGLLWVVLVAIGTVRLVAGVAGVVGMVRRAVPVADPVLLDGFAQAEVRVGLGRRVGLRAAPGLVTPVTAGWLRPVVLVPPGFGHGLDPAHVQAILIHELVHVRRADFATGLVRRVLAVPVGFHPAVAWLERRAAEAREEACDDATARLTDGLVYARALERLERQRPGPGRARALVPAAAPTALRILRLLVPARPRRGRVSVAVGLAAVLTGTVLVAAPGRLDRQARWLARATVPLVDIRARDPAGEFTLALRQGRAVAATIAGRAVPRDRLLQTGNRVRIDDPAGGPGVEVFVKEGGRGIAWTPRPMVR